MRETHELEEALHHHFKNPALLVTALTHTSYANEAKHGVRHNERLEFLGDSVLSIVVAEYLFTHKNMPEGELTRMRASLVCEAALFEFAKQISLGDYLRLGRGEERGGGRCRPSILSDAFEAVIAALYLDGGMETARAFILPFVTGALTDAAAEEDYKTKLQEIVQQNPEERLRYVGPTNPARTTTSISWWRCTSIPTASARARGTAKSWPSSRRRRKPWP